MSTAGTCTADVLSSLATSTCIVSRPDVRLCYYLMSASVLSQAVWEILLHSCFQFLFPCSEGIKIWYELPGDSKTNCRNKITQVSSLNDACSLFLFDSYYACIIALSFLFDSYYACIIALSFFKFFFVVRLKNGPAVHLWKCPAEIWPAS